MSFQTLAEKIAATGYDQARLAIDLTRIGEEDIDPMSGISKKETYTTLHLGGIILGALANVRAPIPIESNFLPIPLAELEPIVKLSYGLESSKMLAARTADEKQREARLMALRMLAAESVMTASLVHQIAIVAYLLDLDDFQPILPSRSSIFDPLFAEEYGVTTRDYFSLLFGAWTMSLKEPTCVPERVFRNSPDKDKLIKVFERILENKSSAIEETGQILEKHFASYEAEGLILGFYSRKPFVRIAKDWYLYPLHPFLRMHVGSGPLFEALELARKDASARGSSSPHTNQFNDWMGKRLERLIRFLIGKIALPENISYEYEPFVGDAKKDLGSDLVVFENDAAVLIGVKLKRLSPGSFFGFDLDSFERDVAKGLGESIWKSIRFIYRLEKAHGESRLNPENRKTSERILGCNKFILLGVSSLMPAVFRGNPFRESIEKNCEEELEPEEWQWYCENRHRFQGWHIIDAEELSSFVAIRENEGLFESLTKYFNQPNFGELARVDGLMPSFKQWFKRLSARDKKGFVPELRDAFNRALEYSVSYMMGKDAVAEFNLDSDG